MAAHMSLFTRGGLIAAALLLVSACAERAAHSTADSAGVMPSPPPTMAVNDTGGCDLSRTVAHPNPDTLLREFVRRDSAGQFTASNEWFNRAVDCPGHEPGPDVATTVRRYELRELSRTDSMLQTEVRWERTGNAASGASGTYAETLSVVRTPYGWRIRSPALNPKVPAKPSRS
jgi:hypothetical protein